MKKIIFAILAVSVLSIGSIFVFAQKGKTHKFHKGFGFHRIAEKLNLSDEQKTQVQQILETSKTKVEPIKNALKENHQKLEDLSEGGTFDETKVQAIAAEQGNLSAQLIVEKERVKAQIFQILTPEQREQAKQMKEKMKNKFKERFKNRFENRTEKSSD